MTEAQPERRRAAHALDVTLARLEAKVDVALAQHGAKIEQHGSELGELRQRVSRVEDRPIASVEGVIDHEHRLRVVEQRDTVTVRQLLAGLAATAGLCAALAPVVARLLAGGGI